jgi:hypothetical protein
MANFVSTVSHQFSTHFFDSNLYRISYLMQIHRTIDDSQRCPRSRDMKMFFLVIYGKFCNYGKSISFQRIFSILIFIESAN